ncbi:MAG TPA: Gfo/Idh/MocA family oxidoreductase [Streptosporangiaceae bacterium]|nr:Gfo/Idh/MocA family oxidoreductase [Streptosporangiaceae bacterium]
MARSRTQPTLGVGMIGYAFMGAAHSQAWRSAPRFFDLPVRVRMSVLAGRDEARAKAAADRYGWDDVETDWTRLMDRDDVDIVDICTPGDTHAEMAIAALEAGKHVLCEKPLANSVAEAEAMAEAARRAAGRGVRAMCGFTYRRVPAARLMADLVADGAIGTLRHVRASYLQDWLVDPAAPMSWRLQKERAGSGALGDIGAHAVDLAQYVTGDPITGVTALSSTFVSRRPVQGTDGFLGTKAAADGDYGEVTVDDATVFLGRTASGALATFEASRFATGHKNGLRLELNGSAGSIVFDLERMNELLLYDARQENPGFRTIVVTEPSHPYIAAWWPPGHTLGYEHAFTHQVRDFTEGIVSGEDVAPTFDDALGVQQVLDAVGRSAVESARWVDVTVKGGTRA